jgi:hypothetical protein
MKSQLVDETATEEIGLGSEALLFFFLSLLAAHCSNTEASHIRLWLDRYNLWSSWKANENRS